MPEILLKTNPYSIQRNSLGKRTQMSAKGDPWETLRKASRGDVNAAWEFYDQWARSVGTQRVYDRYRTISTVGKEQVDESLWRVVNKLTSGEFTELRSAYAYLNGALRFRLNGAANERKGQDCTHLADDIPVIQEPDAPIIQREWSERIQSLCGKLDPDDFEMLRLKFVENLSFQEVADVFEIAVSTLRVARIPRALRRARIVMNELNLDGVVSHEN